MKEVSGGLEVYVRLDVGGVSHHIESPPVVTVTSREGRDVKGFVICTSTENWNTYCIMFECELQHDT